MIAMRNVVFFENLLFENIDKRQTNISHHISRSTNKKIIEDKLFREFLLQRTNKRKDDDQTSSPFANDEKSDMKKFVKK
jgi:hypothetical protein